MHGERSADVQVGGDEGGGVGGEEVDPRGARQPDPGLKAPATRTIPDRYTPLTYHYIELRIVNKIVLIYFSLPVFT